MQFNTDRTLTRIRIDIDPARLELIAASLRGDRRRIAQALGMGLSTLNKRLAREARLRAAHNRGCKRAGASGHCFVSPPDAPPGDLPQAVAALSDHGRAVYDAIAADVRTIGDIKGETGLTSRELGAALDELETHLLVKSRPAYPLTHYYLMHEEVARA